MRKKVIPFFLPVVLLFSHVLLWAQEGTLRGGMEQEPAYITYLSGNIDVDRTPNNEISDFEPAELDMELPIGTIIRTGRDSLCEITIPGRSLMRLASGTVFQIEQSEAEEETGTFRERFNFLAGKFKATVEKFTTKDSEYSVVSGTTLAGVRGSELGGAIKIGKGADFLCFEGELVIESTEGVFEPIVLTSGERSYVPKEGVPSPVQTIPEETLKQWEQEFATEEEYALALEKEEEVLALEEEEEVEEAVEEPEVVLEPEKPKSVLETALSLNAWIGTLTIGNDLYAHWVFAPELTIGKFGMGLYFPAIFSPDVGLFGFNGWYNHDEWDFQNLQDGIHDALLKFYYIRWGQKGDPLFFKIGGIDDFTLGHGFIVNGYSNMVYFPIERSMGVQFDLDTDRFGFETMVADLSRFELMGGRIYTRPLGRIVPFAVGVTVVRDRPVPATSPNNLQEPNVFVFGADVEFAFIDTSALGMKAYADAATVGYLYPELPASLSGKTIGGMLGFLPSVGTGIGIMGNISETFTFRAEYRFFIGYYEPGIIDFGWESRRLYYGQELEGLIADTSYRDSTQSGFLLQGGLLLFRKVSLGIGFESYTMTRHSIAESKNELDTVNRGELSLGIRKGLIPKLSGSVSYRREDNLETIFQQPFDSNTKLEASVTYELAEGVAIAVNAKRAFLYNDVTGQHEPIDTLGVKTVFTFF